MSVRIIYTKIYTFDNELERSYEYLVKISKIKSLNNVMH